MWQGLRTPHNNIQDQYDEAKDSTSSTILLLRTHTEDVDLVIGDGRRGGAAELQEQSGEDLVIHGVVYGGW